MKVKDFFLDLTFVGQDPCAKGVFIQKKWRDLNEEQIQCICVNPKNHIFFDDISESKKKIINVNVASESEAESESELRQEPNRKKRKG